ncbi:MAG: glycosyltransferase family 2 protein, partial [Bacteroidales bacterium]|nr:glycosyltransferase family 2 protein [Bacteroidales bacterium]
MSKLITILVPAYNEESVLPMFYKRLTEVINKLPYRFEILFVNDGSKDKTIDILHELREKDKRISFVSLSRNYGKEIAMAAGFDHTKGDALVVIDADLQDPPELIEQMIKKWEEGYDDVYAQRISRQGETWLKKVTSKMFYRLLGKLTRVEIQRDTGDFRLLSRRVIEALKQYKESERYTKGFFSLVGFKKVAIKYHRDPRAAGQTKWNYVKLFNLAVEGITSFTIAPLKLSTFFGFLLSIVAFAYMIVIVAKTIIYGEPVQGYPSLISIILFLGGVQLMSL